MREKELNYGFHPKVFYKEHSEKPTVVTSTDSGPLIVRATIRFFFPNYISFSASALLSLYQLFSYKIWKNLGCL